MQHSFKSDIVSRRRNARFLKIEMICGESYAEDQRDLVLLCIGCLRATF